MIKIIIRERDVKLWFRNSLYTKQIAFSVSDIDLTIQAPVEKKHILKNIDRLRKKIPIIGEVVFLRSDLDDFLFLLNPLEAMRDPVLSRKIDINNISKIQRDIFLIKMFEADVENIKNNFLVRKNKWVGHIRLSGLSINDSELQTSDDLLKIVAESMTVGTREASRLLRNSIDRKDEKISEELFRFNPVSWISKSLELTRFNISLKEAQTYALQSHELVYEHLKWELWGLYTQFHSLEKNNLERHLKNIIKLIKVIRVDDSLTNELLSRGNLLLKEM